MIKYELRCRDCEHQFEGWFADSATYDQQAEAGEILCPMCSCADVGKAIMAPNIAVRRETRAPTKAQMAAELRRMLMTVRRQVEENCDYVGADFADEARKMHRGEVEERGIYGEATATEAEDLRDEGIDVMALPWVPRSDA
jgi:hypothetical protein